MQFDSSGRLKLVNNSSTGSPLTVRASGAFGAVSASSVSTLTFSGTFLTASNATSGEVIVSYFNNPPIMYLSGFRSDTTTPANRNLYLVTSSGFFSGSERFMCSVLYSNPWPATAPDSTCLAGCATSPYATAGDWKMLSLGSEVFDDDQFWFSTGLNEGGASPGLSPFGKWHIAYAFYSIDEINQGYLNLDAAAPPYIFGVAAPTWTTTISFSIGGFGNGATYDGGGPTRIAAVALATASYVVDKETLFRYFQQVYRDGDIRQNGIMNWDHIWSVKQNTPGATWRDAVGVMHLNRSGTLTIGTESNPRWA
jgi:hypothetical protein